MAIKPRPKKTSTPSDAEIDAFAQGGLDAPVAPVPAMPAPRISRQLLLKFPDDELPLAIADASRRSGRNNKSSTAMRAITLGLKVMEERGELDSL